MIIYVVQHENDIVTAFISLRNANEFIQGTNFTIHTVDVQDAQSMPDHA